MRTQIKQLVSDPDVDDDAKSIVTRKETEEKNLDSNLLSIETTIDTKVLS